MKLTARKITCLQCNCTKFTKKYESEIGENWGKLNKGLITIMKSLARMPRFRMKTQYEMLVLQKIPLQEQKIFFKEIYQEITQVKL